jgi:hypothetical protein
MNLLIVDSFGSSREKESICEDLGEDAEREACTTTRLGEVGIDLNVSIVAQCASLEGLHNT